MEILPSTQMLGEKMMNRCKYCNVKIYESEKNCPLCHRVIDAAEPSDTAVIYPQYQNIVSKKSQLRKLPIFFSIVAAIVCGYINIFTHTEGRILWSVIVAASLIFANSVFYVTQSTSKRFGAKVLLYYLLLSGLMVAIDLTTGVYFWSTNYVFPFLTLGTTLYLTVLAIRSKRLFSEYFGYVLVVLLIGLSPVVIHLLGFSNVAWGAFVTVITCIIVFIGLLMFFHKSFKDEIYKRFHR